MPWQIQQNGTPSHPFCVCREDGEKVACFADEAAARQMASAMYAAEPAADAADRVDALAGCDVVERLDHWTLQTDALEETSIGGVRATAYMTTDGVFDYPQEDGSVLRELRPLDEIASPKALASMQDMPVTVGHPAGGVDGDNFQELTVGHVSGIPVLDGRRVKGRLVIQERRAADGIRRGELSEVSQGYKARLLRVSGVDPHGRRFDAVQMGQVYNHNALLRRGEARLGRGMTVRADSTQETPTMADKNPATITIGGIPFPADSPAAAAAVAQLEANAAKQRQDAEALQGRLDAMQRQIDEQAGALQASAAADAARALSALKDEAKILVGDKLDLASLATPRAVMEAAIAHVDPRARFEGRADAYVQAAFDQHVANVKKRRAVQAPSPTKQVIAAADAAAAPSASAKTHEPTTQVADGTGHTAQAAWDRMVERQRNLGRRAAGERG